MQCIHHVQLTLLIIRGQRTEYYENGIAQVRYIDGLYVTSWRPCWCTGKISENDIFSVSDTGILGKRNSEFSQQEWNLRPSDY